MRRGDARPQDSPASRPPKQRIDDFIRDEMRRQRIPGVAVAIVNKSAATARGYGYANLEHMVPVTDETIFQSGSLGKMFTATAVMLQVEPPSWLGAGRTLLPMPSTSDRGWGSGREYPRQTGMTSGWGPPRRVRRRYQGLHSMLR